MAETVSQVAMTLLACMNIGRAMLDTHVSVPIDSTQSVLVLMDNVDSVLLFYLPIFGLCVVILLCIFRLMCKIKNSILSTMVT